eukprot:jgi/Galph1/5031/GphlegSOOS_G51.1
MAAVRAGGDRQFLHEEIRKLSMEAASRVKEYGEENDLLERSHFVNIRDQLDEICSPKQFIGRAPQQVEEFMEQVDGLLLRNGTLHFNQQMKYKFEYT